MASITPITPSIKNMVVLVGKSVHKTFFARGSFVKLQV